MSELFWEIHLRLRVMIHFLNVGITELVRHINRKLTIDDFL